MAKEVKVLIADDDPFQLEYIGMLVAKARPAWRIVAAVASGDEAKDAIAEFRPDLLVLDVRLGDSSGIDLVRELNGAYPVIFVTGDSSFAAWAFDCEAVDYVVKPIVPARLWKALDRAERVLQSGHQRDTTSAMVAGRAVPVPAWPTTIRMLKGLDTIVLPVDDVRYFRADRKYTHAVLQDSEGLLRIGISDVQRQVDPAAFWRVHRSLIVNVHHLKRAYRDELGRLCLAVEGRLEPLQVSRQFEHLFKDGFA